MANIEPEPTGATRLKVLHRACTLRRNVSLDALHPNRSHAERGNAVGTLCVLVGGDGVTGGGASGGVGTIKIDSMF